MSFLVTWWFAYLRRPQTHNQLVWYNKSYHLWMNMYQLTNAMEAKSKRLHNIYYYSGSHIICWLSYCQLPRWRLEPMTGGVMPMHLVRDCYYITYLKTRNLGEIREVFIPSVVHPTKWSGSRGEFSRAEGWIDVLLLRLLPIFVRSCVGGGQKCLCQTKC